MKHSFERKGDRWEPKDGKGPSDVRGRSKMTKEQLAEAIAHKQK